jgi:hypothetical protein
LRFNSIRATQWISLYGLINIARIAFRFFMQIGQGARIIKIYTKSEWAALGIFRRRRRINILLCALQVFQLFFIVGGINFVSNGAKIGKRPDREQK